MKCERCHNEHLNKKIEQEDGVFYGLALNTYDNDGYTYFECAGCGEVNRVISGIKEAQVKIAMQMKKDDFIKWADAFMNEDFLGSMAMFEKIIKNKNSRKELTQDEMFEAYCKTGVKND